MSRCLTIGMIQMSISRDAEENFRRIERGVDVLMRRSPRPELIVGVEGGIGYGVREKIPGAATDRFGGMARRYGVYLVPGTMFEIGSGCPAGKFYNSAPVFGPNGELIDVYRKMAPWYPAEYRTQPGNRYVVFEIAEKGVKVGLLLCYDLNFPEISRNLALMGAEVLLKLTEDFEEAYRMNRPVHLARAIENQAFLVSSNAVGQADGYSMYGHSMAVDPSGRILLEAGNRDALLSVTIDADEALSARKYGTAFQDHYLGQLKKYHFPMPYSANISSAPLYQELKDSPDRPSDFQKDLLMDHVGNPRTPGKGGNELG